MKNIVMLKIFDKKKNKTQVIKEANVPGANFIFPL